MVLVRAGQANILFWFPSYRSMTEEGLHVERVSSLGLPSHGLFHTSQSITTHTIMQGFLTRPLIQLINLSETYLASTHLLKCIQKRSIKNTFGVTVNLQKVMLVIKKIITVVKLEREENLQHSDILVSGKRKRLHKSEVVLWVHPLCSLCLSN